MKLCRKKSTDTRTRPSDGSTNRAFEAEHATLIRAGDRYGVEMQTFGVVVVCVHTNDEKWEEEKGHAVL